MCQKCNDGRLVAEQGEWDKVLGDLDGENLKPALYDHTVVEMMRPVEGKRVFDFGCGPGVMALALQKMGAKVKVWDINPDMRAAAAAKIGAENVYASVEATQLVLHDVVLCNLVLCIVPDEEVREILHWLCRRVSPDGKVYVGFCNPHIFQVAESQLDFRFPTGAAYDEPHRYRKVKKEGGYEIFEDHRPEAWYEAAFQHAGLQVLRKEYTPEYVLNEVAIRDFVVYELARVPDLDP